MTRFVPWLLLAVAAWPSLAWYATRMKEGIGDDRCGLVALALAMAFALRAGRVAGRTHTTYALPALAVALHALAVRFAPPLVGAGVLGLAMVALAHAQGSPLARRPAWLALVLLALPVIASLQFYLGFPLRCAVAAAAAAVIGACGFDVVVDGTAIVLRGVHVFVDEPCSGVKTLWTSAVFASAVALHCDLDGRAARWFLAASTALAALATIARTVLLTLLESGAAPAPVGLHTGIGLAVFAGFAVVLVHCANALRSRAPARSA